MIACGRRNKILEFKFTDTYSMKPRGHIQICIQGLSLLLVLSPLFGEQLNALESTKNYISGPGTFAIMFID